MTADVETRTRLRCDEKGCRNTFPTKGDRPLFAGHETTRKVAADAGWSYHPMRGDFCPEHTKGDDQCSHSAPADAAREHLAEQGEGR